MPGENGSAQPLGVHNPHRRGKSIALDNLAVLALGTSSHELEHGLTVVADGVLRAIVAADHGTLRSAVTASGRYSTTARGGSCRGGGSH